MSCAAMSWKTWLYSLQSRKLGPESRARGTPSWWLVSQSTVSRPASLYGSGRSSTAFTTLKMAVLAPMPSASASTATAVNPGFLASTRPAKRTSCHRFPIDYLAVAWNQC